MSDSKGIIDGLDPELMAKVGGRREALGSIGRFGMGIALASTPLAFALMSKSAFAQGGTLPADIVAVLNFALTLEYLEAEFYTMGVAAGSLIPAGDRPIFALIRDHENQHVAFLKSVLGANATAKPTFDFTAGGAFADVFSNYETFKALAQAFEDTGVRAYKGQAANLAANDVVLTAALQIHSVEARHASMVRRIRGEKGWITNNQRGSLPAPAQPIYDGEDVTTQAGVDLRTLTSLSTTALSEAFDEPLTKDQVLGIAGLFIR